MDIVSFVVIGAAVSILVQYLKNKFRTESNITLVIVLGVSIVCGTAYYFVKDTNLWEPIIAILGFAGAVYTYILKRFEY